MKPFLVLIPSIVLAYPAPSWAADGFSGMALAYAPYLALILGLAVLGLGVGVAAARKRGLNPFLGAAGGFLLGPLCFLLFFVPRRGGPKLAEPTCPACGERLAEGQTSCKSCGWDPERRSAAAHPGPARPKRRAPAKANAGPRIRRSPETADDLSSEFAQYSEMLRKTLPGALDRAELIDYTEKFAQIAKDDTPRCSNPDCNRLLPPSCASCPHCGAPQIGSAQGPRRQFG